VKVVPSATLRRAALTRNARPPRVAGGSAPNSPNEADELALQEQDAEDEGRSRWIYFDEDEYDLQRYNRYASPSASALDEGARRSYEDEDAASARAAEQHAYEAVQIADEYWRRRLDASDADFVRDFLAAHCPVPFSVQREAAERSWAAEDAHAAPSPSRSEHMSDGGDVPISGSSGGSAHGSPVQVAGGSGRSRSPPEAVPDERGDTPQAKRVAARAVRATGGPASGRALFADSGSSDIESPQLTALPALQPCNLSAREALELMRARRDAGGARNGGATVIGAMLIAAQHQHEQQLEQQELPQEQTRLASAALVLADADAPVLAPAAAPTAAPTAAPSPALAAAPAAARAASPAASDITQCGCGDGDFCDFHLAQRLHARVVVEETPPDVLAAAMERDRLLRAPSAASAGALRSGTGGGAPGTLAYFYQHKPPRTLDERMDDDTSLALRLGVATRTPAVDAAVNAAPYPIWTDHAGTLEEALALRNAELARRGRPPTEPSKPAPLCIIGCGQRAHIGSGKSKALNCPLVIGLADPQCSADFCTFVRDLRYERFPPLFPFGA
jgi:hypothetical protein